MHTVQGVQDTGSIAMVNGDVLNEIALAAGSYPQRHGDHTGAELNFLMREGSRDRVRGQFRPSITDMSLVLEGPLGSSKRGSWLDLRAGRAISAPSSGGSIPRTRLRLGFTMRR